MDSKILINLGSIVFQAFEGFLKMQTSSDIDRINRVHGQGYHTVRPMQYGVPNCSYNILRLVDHDFYKGLCRLQIEVRIKCRRTWLLV